MKNMSTPQVTLEEYPIEFVVPGKEGFQIDVLEAELLIEAASDVWKKDFVTYKDALREKLASRVGATLTDGQLFKFVEAISLAYSAFKKKLDSELPLALGLPATPSESASENS